jgi:hypothetical protein
MNFRLTDQRSPDIHASTLTLCPISNETFDIGHFYET